VTLWRWSRWRRRWRRWSSEMWAASW